MTYTTRDDITLTDGERAVELESGELVAVRAEVIPPPGEAAAYVVEAQARVIDASGASQADAAGNAVVTRLRSSISLEHWDEHGRDPIIREHLLLVLGEPATLIDGQPVMDWSESLRRDVSIKNRIAAAVTEAGTVDLSNLL